MDKYLSDKVIDERTGVVKTTVNYDGISKKNKTIFPSSWTFEQLLDEMQAAMLNPINILDRGGSRIEYTGIGTTGIKIKMVFEKAGEFVTMFPVVEKVKGI